MPGPSNVVRFAAIGDVHGSFSAVPGALRAAKRALGGSCDFVLSVGDTEANRNARDAAGVATGGDHRRWTGEFPKVLAERIRLPLPVHFIGGDREPWAALDTNGPGTWGPHMSFLGRAGVTDVGGVKVAYLSGVRGEASGWSLGERQSRDERGWYLDAELVALRRALVRHGGVDVLVTHDWPAGLNGDFTVGDPHIRALCNESNAALMLCGHRHTRHSGEVGSTAVEALGPITAKRDGWAAFVRHPDGRIERVDAVPLRSRLRPRSAS